MNFKWVQKHKAEIIFGISLVGMVGGTVLACKETPKALQMRDEAEKKKGSKLTTWETVKAMAPAYVPSACVIGGSAAGMVSVLKGKNKMIGVLSAAAASSEKALADYKSKVVQTIGPAKEQQVRTEIAKDATAKVEIPDTIISTGKTPIFDMWSGRYFEGDMDTIRGRFVDAYTDLMRHGPDEDYYLSVNDLYDRIGLPKIPAGDEMGWNASDDIGIDAFKPDFLSHLKDGRTPVLALEFGTPPRPGYLDKKIYSRA